jgi:hypothetical protein
MGKWRGVNRYLVGKLDGRSPLGRPRRRSKDNNKMDLQEIGCGSIECIELAQYRTGGGETLGSIKCWEFLD